MKKLQIVLMLSSLVLATYFAARVHYGSTFSHPANFARYVCPFILVVSLVFLVLMDLEKSLKSIKYLIIVFVLIEIGWFVLEKVMAM